MTNVPAADGHREPLPDGFRLDKDGKIQVQRRRLDLLNLQASLEAGEARDIAFTSPIWAKVSLPHRRVSDALWTVQNGDVALTIQPGVGVNLETGVPEVKPIPYGVIPRQALTFMVTWAVRNQERVVPLGDSLREFMSLLGISYGSKARRNVVQQMEALASCRVTVSERATTANGSGYRQRHLPFTEGLDLWVNGSDQPGLWGSSAILSQEFYDSILAAPLPVYLQDLRALRGSSMRLDIYFWLVYRLYYLHGTTRITWAQLHTQFGGSYSRERDFIPNFQRALRDVLAIYSTARVEATSQGLTLRQSPRHVDGAAPKRIAPGFERTPRTTE